MSILKLSTFAAIAAVIAAPAVSQNTSSSPFYVSGFVGTSLSSNSDFTGVSNPDAGVPGPTGAAGVPLSVDVDFDSNVYFGGAVGAHLPFTFFGIFHPRIELEISSLDSDTNTGSFNNGTQTFSGNQDATFYYFNNYSDIIFNDDQRLIPYIGGGIGFANVRSDVGYFPASATAPVFAVQGEDTAFATHTAIGATYKVNNNVGLYTEGRYFQIRGVDLERRFIGGGANLFSGNVSDNIDGFTITGGLRFSF